MLNGISLKTSATVVLLLLCVSTFSACGKKGSLYLPADPEPAIETSDAVPDEPTESTESTDSKKKPADQ